MNWIEKLFGLGLSIDGGDGKVETLVVAAIAVVVFITISLRVRHRPLRMESRSTLP